MSEALLALVASDAETRARRDLEDFEDVEATLRACMRGAKNHWMVINHEEQCQGALAACHRLVNEDGKERIEASLNHLKALNALMSGVPVDIDRLSEQTENGPKPIPIARMWAEVQAED